MNKEQAFNILVNFVNVSLKKGQIENIGEAGIIATAIEVIRTELFQSTPATNEPTIKRPEIIQAEPPK